MTLMEGQRPAGMWPDRPRTIDTFVQTLPLGTVGLIGVKRAEAAQFQLPRADVPNSADRLGPENFVG